jgi:pyridinium-3,5-biscarboxylic acid mononucleotide sulfurtransferase
VTDYLERRQELLADLARLPSVAVAFSGGVDSSVLLHAAHSVLGPRCLGVIADSPSLPRAELQSARAFAADVGCRLIVVSTNELFDEGYARNGGDRCYFCKRALFDAMALVADREGIAHLALGEISEDALEDRPGARAAREARVLAPLAGAGFHKPDVRRYAREAGLAVAEKPAGACLASRLPVGTRVTAERLGRVETAEAKLRALGLRVLRVRDHGRRARLEVGAGEERLARSQSENIGLALRQAGFPTWELATYVAPPRGGPDPGRPLPIRSM